ncbi:hypothetical protein, partial [Bacillus cereus]|uniref:hypothetical protein n=1 Tax=Bacillus cereus TaxID=1396 RepID=UPI004041833D
SFHWLFGICFDTMGFPRSSLRNHNLAYENTMTTFGGYLLNYYPKAQSVIETASVLVVIAMARVTDFLS